MAQAPLKVGFLGAGYIAKWHADALRRVKGATLAGVFDVSRSAADAFAREVGAKVYGAPDEMLADGEVDVVHVLTPPPAHGDAARRVIEAGKHVFVEKPLALSAAEARELSALADAKGVKLGVNHNFLMLPGYDRLRRDIARGTFGPIDAFNANWRFPLPPLRSGPYGLWMLRTPQNLLFELGPHLFAFVADLFDGFNVKDVTLRYPIEIPGGITHHQGWRISGLAGDTAVTLDLSLIEGVDDRSIELRGIGARARFDFAADAYAIDKPVFGDIVVGPLMSELSRAAQSARTALVNAARQTVSLNALAPYGLSITRACQSFYKSIETAAPVDRRLGAGLAARAAAMIEAALAAAALETPRWFKVVREPVKQPPTMLVIGGTGFIGRYLVAALVAAGHGVRVLSRSRGAAFDSPVEVCTGDLKSETDLLAAMEGIDGVFHLARAEEKSWDAYLENDVGVARRVGECCVRAGVKRLVYAGTIDCYDASRADRPINEHTGFDDALEERNLYARSKAACETALKSLASDKGLPLVIVRPGVVIGRGGPLQHWGIAMWRGAAACKLWGRGDNVMPFVAARDAADGFARAMAAPGAEGRAFNLVGEPLLTARDYVEAVGRANGVRIDARPTPILAYYLVDLAKYWAKRLLARRSGLSRPSYRDWKSRAQLSPYENAAAKDALGWRPIADRDAFIRATVFEANLFGVDAPPAKPAAIADDAARNVL